MRAGYTKVYAILGRLAPSNALVDFGGTICRFPDSCRPMPPISSCTPRAFNVSGQSSQCFGCIITRSLLGSPLVIVGERFELGRNHSVGHGLGGAEQSLRRFQLLLAAL